MKIRLILLIMVVLITISFFQINKLMNEMKELKELRLNFVVAVNHTLSVYGESIMMIFDIMKNDPFFRDELARIQQLNQQKQASGE